MIRIGIVDDEKQERDQLKQALARFGAENKQRWLELVRKYGEPDVQALAEHYHMRLVD